jgi:glyoxylase-like metal-dependent hydrolase (beta-lactamase superfamily II)
VPPSHRLAAGSFPPSWVDGTEAEGDTPLQSWAYEPTTYIFRESPRSHFEAPFVYLLVGSRRALLVDTGTGTVDVELHAAIDAALDGRELELVVAHTHRHGDHVGGDAALSRRARTTVVARPPVDAIELGDRTVDVLAIPGHEPSHVAFYDRKTGLLLTGDSLYPGRIYVTDLDAFRDSVERLVAFVAADHPVAHVLGSHIELSASGEEYDDGASAHPGERQLALGSEALDDLLATLRSMGATPARTRRPDYVIVPQG